MKVTLIEPRGFCFGVCRALKMLDALLPEHPYVLHEIVHNKQIIQDYQQKGVRFVEKLDDVPPKARLVLSAHGVGKDVEQKAKESFTVTDTTCPFVKKNHLWIQKLESQGIPVVLIGKPNHAEIIGMLGQLVQKAFVISRVEEVKTLPDFDVVGVATQTTLSMEDTEQIILALRKKFKNIFFQNGVCMATQERQKAVKQAALTHQLIIVVGDKKSSNANRLVEVAQNAGADSILVETVQDLKNRPIPDSVAITAAASAPERIVTEIFDFLKSL